MPAETFNHIEQWAAWPEDNRYEVSSFGRVRRSGSEKELSQHTGRDGYRRITVCIGRKRKPTRVHRMVASCFIQNPSRKPCVNHRDGVKTNNHADNLEWCTLSENTKHAYDTGLMPSQSGAKNHASKLTEDQAMRVIELWKEGKNQCAIARLMGVTNSCVHLIVHGKIWPHLTIKSYEQKQAV